MSDNKVYDTEAKFIYLLLHYKDLVGDYLESTVSRKYFSKKYQFLLQCIEEAYNENGVRLTREAYKERLKELKSPKERVYEDTKFGECFISRTEKDNFPVLLQKIIDRYLAEEVGKVIEEFRNTFDQDKIKTIQRTVEGFQDILYSSVSSEEELFYDDISVLSETNIKYIEDYRAGKIEAKKLITCGIKEIDETMITGFERGTLTLFCGDVGGYKSTIMMNVALNIWEQGFNVLFVPLEMDKDQMWRRVISRQARVPYVLITRDYDKLTDDQIKKVKEASRKFSENDSRFYMLQESQRTTVPNIHNHIKRNIEMFKPDLVVIDYIANLEAHQSRPGRNDLEIGDMLKEMRHMGKIMGFATISAAQLGRDFLKKIRKAGANRDKAVIHSEDIRGSHEFAADSDNIYAQLKSISQPNQLVDLFCVKSRNGPQTFAGGEVRATLEVIPEMFVIRSQTGFEDIPGDDILDDLEDAITDPAPIKKDTDEDDDFQFEEIFEGRNSEELNNNKSFVSKVSLNDDFDFMD
jgi:replicative DNA helicase